MVQPLVARGWTGDGAERAVVRRLSAGMRKGKCILNEVG